jgi:hypothetical protein
MSHNDSMDANGARHLAARIGAGVPVGAIVELLGDVPADLGLSTGDRGVVEEIAPEGTVMIAWERGFSLEIDPRRTPIRRLAA